MTHITIDLDYQFNQKLNTELNKKTTDEEFLEFVHKFLNSSKSGIVVESHEQIVPFVNSRCFIDKIINIDYHSDIIHENFINYKGKKTVVDIENEGMWANCIVNREIMNFEWRYPDKDKDSLYWGYCDTEPTSWCPKLMGYKLVRKYHGLPKINIKKIDSYSICYSPNWIEDNYDWLKKELK